MKTVTLDGAVLASKEALHQTLAQALAFPDWDGLGDYGQRVKKVLLAAARENDRITLQVI